jgi:hypothetical protein
VKLVLDAIDFRDDFLRHFTPPSYSAHCWKTRNGGAALIVTGE